MFLSSKAAKVGILAWFVATGLSEGQNMVLFSNKGATVDAPFYDSNGVLLSGTNYVAQLYAGAEPNVLYGFGQPTSFQTGSRAGYFSAPNGVQLPSYVTGPQCGPAYVQVRAWAAAGGSTFENAAFFGYWTGISSTIYLPWTGGCGGGVPSPWPELSGLQYPGPPMILQQPPDRRVGPRAPTGLWVVASGGGKVTYQWYSGVSGDISAPVPGATTPVYDTPYITNNVSYWVRIRDSAGSLDSTTANITVVPYYAGTLSAAFASGFPALTIMGSAENYGQVQLEYTSQLNPPNWALLTNLWQSAVPVTFVDTSATNFPRRFYRLALP